MGIIHHSNYIRWFEEARTDVMERRGIGYKAMEECGIYSPVLSISCEYKTMVHYSDTVRIAMREMCIRDRKWAETTCSM